MSPRRLGVRGLAVLLPALAACDSPPPSAYVAPAAAAPLAVAAPSAEGAAAAPELRAVLTVAEHEALAAQLERCWGAEAGELRAPRLVVEQRVELDAGGHVRQVRAGPAGVPGDPRARVVYESARRALLSPQCNPLRVPPDRLQAVSASTFRFSPRGLVR